MPASLPLVALTLTLLSQADPATPIPPPQTDACRAATLADLRRCVSANDLLLVATTDHDVIRGRYKGILNGQLLVETGATSSDPVRAFSDSDVVEVAVLRVRRRAADIRDGAASAGVSGALFGSASVDWASYGLVIASLTAIGAAARIVAPLAYPEPVYTAGGPGPLASATTEILARGTPPPVAFDQLPQRIQTNQHIRLRDTSHVVIVGRFAGVEDDRLVVRAGEQVVRVPQRDIRLLERRVRAFPSRRRAATVGVAVTLALMAIGWAATTPAERALDPSGPAVYITGAAMGALAGVGLAETIGRYRYEPVAVQERIPTTLAWRF